MDELKEIKNELEDLNSKVEDILYILGMMNERSNNVSYQTEDENELWDIGINLD